MNWDVVGESRRSHDGGLLQVCAHRSRSPLLATHGCQPAVGKINPARLSNKHYRFRLRTNGDPESDRVCVPGAEGAGSYNGLFSPIRIIDSEARIAPAIFLHSLRPWTVRSTEQRGVLVKRHAGIDSDFYISACCGGRLAALCIHRTLLFLAPQLIRCVNDR